MADYTGAAVGLVLGVTFGTILLRWIFSKSFVVVRHGACSVPRPPLYFLAHRAALYSPCSHPRAMGSIP